MNSILRKCKSLSKLGRTSSYSNLRSKSARGSDEEEDEDPWGSGDATAAAAAAEEGGGYGGGDSNEVATVLVGNSRRPYLISSKHLNHPVMSALINRSPPPAKKKLGEVEVRVVKCEVVVFDHLLWMLENVDAVADDAATLEELAELYTCS